MELVSEAIAFAVKAHDGMRRKKKCTVEKAYQRMSVEGCEFIAKGANGAVYRYDAETILKTYFAKDALPEIKQERENARKASVFNFQRSDEL